MTKYPINLPIDCPERTMLHREIILKKKPLKELYEDWYSIFVNEAEKLPNDIIIELGSGGGFLKKSIPNIKCSDILDLPTNDLTFSALEMPFPDDYVGGFFMLDTFHHIPDCELFLNEVSRTLTTRGGGGKLVMIEPANSLWGRFIYKNFHHEPFDPEGVWSIPATGPLSGANGALPWIVFIRDNQKFCEKYPELKIESIEYINPLTYLLTGGVSREQFLPDWFFPIVRLIDRILPKISRHFSMFMVIKIVQGN